MVKKKYTFEQALARLEEISEVMEDPKTTLEDSIALYKEGMELSLFCTKKLDSVEKEVMILQKNLDGKLVLNPFNASEE